MMPDATIVKTVIKSTRATLERSSKQRPTHRSRMHVKRMRFAVVIVAYRVQFCLNGKVSHYL